MATYSGPDYELSLWGGCQYKITPEGADRGTWGRGKYNFILS